MKKSRRSHSPVSKAVAQLPEKLKRALALHRAGQLFQAQAAYKEILAVRPKHFDALHLLGMIAAQTGDPKSAVDLIGSAIEIDPANPAPHNNRGLALTALKQWEAALNAFDHAIALKADYAEAFFTRGNVFYELAQWDAALASYEQAITLRANYVEACCNRGLVLAQLKRFDAALASYSQAIASKPDHAEAYSNRGIVFGELKQWEAALASFNQAIALKAGYAEAHCNRAVVLRELKQWAAALESYDQAIKLKADYAEAYRNRGNLLGELKQWQEAMVSYEHTLKLKPDHQWLYGTWLHAKMQACDWDSLDAQIERLVARMERAERATAPLEVLGLVDSPEVQRRAAEIWVEATCPASLLPTPGPRSRSDKIRIGYFSPDFRDHPVARLTAELFETHDRSRFEITAFSLAPGSEDDMSKRLKHAFDFFLDVHAESDEGIACLAQQRGIDIAVDLAGHTKGSRPRIFALRAAPLQVNYIGYLGTFAAQYMDYLVADATLIPDTAQRHYSEKIIYLPSYQANDSQRRISDRIFTRAELDLPQNGFVYCCFNASYKIMPATFSGWMRILSRVEGSVLFLIAGNQGVADNLRREADSRGVDGARLVFGKRVPADEYLARYRAADLFLDTLPYNAGTTASDALWAGLPVLTCVGQAFAGRMAASLLTAIELPELITSTSQQYEDLAVELALGPKRLADIKRRLAQNRLTTRLFDTLRFTQSLEAAYRIVFERFQAGLPPEHTMIE
jgi:predicted O-linked N-acetylglucosamine transferase (SPINDLY family)